MNGWINLHRKILDHWTWEEKPFSKGQALVDLLLLANYQDGAVLRSIQSLAERWGWSRTKTTSFIKKLEKEHTIVQKKDTEGFRIIIENYSKYQNGNFEKRHKKDIKKAQKKPKKDTNNNINNKIKEIYSSNEEYTKKADEAELKEILGYFEQNICQVSAYIFDEVEQWLKKVDKETIMFAIQEAERNNKKSWAYIRAVLQNLEREGVKTGAEARRRNTKKSDFAEHENQQSYDFDAIEKRALNFKKKGC